ncbi:MAG TPA: type IV pilin protein [Deltaproteobacteria bacterium]|nr:type IV pilin protein [Deltaproteobacteria bacterium]HQI02445.1 type IV pilin protein [Deltaproteobacteria bacterium]
MGKKGFSLLEIMAVVVIVGILAAIAIPSYTGYVTRTRRTEAVTALQTVALAEEKHRAEDGVYESEAHLVAQGYLKPASGGEYTPSEYYDINITDVADTTFTASAVGKGAQAGDVTFAINQDGTCGRLSGGAFVADPELWKSLRK